MIPPSTSNVQVLPYGAPPRRPLWRRPLARIAMALVLGILLVRGGMWLYWKEALAYRIHQCLNYALAPDTIVVSAKFGTDGHAVLAAGPKPACLVGLTRLQSMQSMQSAVGNIIFMHERTSPAGHRRLVCIYFSSNYVSSAYVKGHLMNLNLGCLSVDLFDADSAKLLLPMWPSTGWRVPRRIYAGQPDPKDASHFTVRYVNDRGEFLLDGWLLDNEQIEFRNSLIVPATRSAPSLPAKSP
jgi:hypothetical protein